MNGLNMVCSMSSSNKEELDTFFKVENCLKKDKNNKVKNGNIKVFYYRSENRSDLTSKIFGPDFGPEVRSGPNFRFGPMVLLIPNE